MLHKKCVRKTESGPRDDSSVNIFYFTYYLESWTNKYI